MDPRILGLYLRRHRLLVSLDPLSKCLRYAGSSCIRGQRARSAAIPNVDPSTCNPDPALHPRPPTQARVVICGGGLVGASVAYHLAKAGMKDVVLLEQGRIGCGSTLSSSGLLGQLRESSVETQICKSTLKLYKELSDKGLPTGWKKCGSLLLARNKDRMISFKRLASFSVCNQVECEILTPSDAQKLCPIIKVDDLEGALWVPGDAVVDSFLTCQSLLGEAIHYGVKVFEKCLVKRVLSHHNKVVAVETDHGTITCEYFVNCGGLWARHVGQLSDPAVKVPLHPCQHHYLHTKPIPELDFTVPVVRDVDGCVYFREKDGCILAGGFEPVSKPAYDDRAEFSSQESSSLPEDWDHFQMLEETALALNVFLTTLFANKTRDKAIILLAAPCVDNIGQSFKVLLNQLLHRVPMLKNVCPDRLHNGAECFTPDGNWILGESPEIQKYFVASGTKTMGAVTAGGIGELVASWLINNAPPLDVVELDIQRFIGLHNNRKFLRDRVKEMPGLHYRISYPFMEFDYGRKLRMSPIYPRLRDAGATFSQTMGYERPAWFEPPKTGLEGSPQPFRVGHTNTFGKPAWFDRVHAEYKVCREGVALLDYSSFTKLELRSKGREVVDFLQYLCSNDIDVPIGTIAHTGMQNERGGYENDCSLARLADNHFMMIAPTIQQARCLSWLQRHAPSDGSVSVTDITSLYTAICVMGAHSRHLLAELTNSDMSSAAFPFFTFREADVGLASHIRVMNITHTGEIGWILYVPAEFALHVYERLISAGAKYDIQHAGAMAMRTLRIEKFYAFWGQDLDTTTTPQECGRGFRVKFDKGEFIGRKALLAQRQEGIKRRYVQLIVEDHDLYKDPWPWRHEPIFRDGKYVGITTTTCYGYTLEKQVCLGFVQNFDSNRIPQPVTHDFVTKGNFEVEIAGKRFPVKVNLHSPHLPSGDMEITSSQQDRYMATQAA